MSHETALGEDDIGFEQLLLGAGRAETLPSERTEAALLRFAAGVAALQGGVVAGAAAGASATGALTSPWARAWMVGKWLAIGFVAGGVTTFAWLRQPTPVPVAVTAPGAIATTPVALVTEPVAAPMPEPKAIVEPRPLAAEPVARAARAGTTPRTPVKASADLAAEVMALDSIRTALSIGALRDAEQRVSDYRRRFAQGSLRSEAEVLALEVLVAQGRTQAAAAAAERFISLHPRDPQVARVRALVE